VRRTDDLTRIDTALTRIGRVANSRRAVQARAERSGVRLHPATLSTLATVYRHGPLRLTDIADAVELEPSRISKEVARLTAAGLVEARPDPTDRRASLLRTTASGRTAFERYRRAADDILAAALVDWSDTDLAHAAEVLDRLARSVTRPPRPGRVPPGKPGVEATPSGGPGGPSGPAPQP
jgi:DNA-binding MarR family transcriptional regulator